jgi:hypothetical protein
MKTDDIRLHQEKKLSEEIFDLLQGEIISSISQDFIREKKYNSSSDMLEFECYPIIEELYPRLYAICQEVIISLGFFEDIHFYLKKGYEYEINSFLSDDKNDFHVIIINPDLIKKLSEDELKFVIGHEIGLLMCHASRIKDLVEFIYPKNKEISPFLKSLYHLWEKLVIVSADRFGYLAMPDIKTIISYFYKINSGIVPIISETDYNSYLKFSRKIVKKYPSNLCSYKLSSPFEHFRIVALYYFSKSETVHNIIENKDLDYEHELEDNISDLLGDIEFIINSGMDMHKMYFMASAGLIVSGIDKDIANHEIEKMINYLSRFTLNPDKLLEDVSVSGEIESLFDKAVSKIIQSEPEQKDFLLNYLISLITADNKLAHQEIEWLYEVGQKKLGFTLDEIKEILSKYIQEFFDPIRSAYYN